MVVAGDVVKWSSGAPVASGGTSAQRAPAGAPSAAPGLAVAGPVQDAGAVLAQAGAENFTVASRLLPRTVRRHLLAVYGFARLADDLGDEAPGDRAALLDELARQLDVVFAVAGARRSAPGGGACGAAADHADGAGLHPLLSRLTDTVAARDLPRAPFDRLIEANRHDQTTTGHATFADLLAYCRLSATPVGELVLRVVGAASPRNLALADATCVGLQLAELWQDLGEDCRAGRVYLPLDDVARYGYDLDRLERGVADDAFRRLMAFEVARARRFLERGRPLGDLLGGRVGLAVRLYTVGGMLALDELERRRYDTLTTSGRVSRGRLLRATIGEIVRRGWDR